VRDVVWLAWQDEVAASMARIKALQAMLSGVRPSST
jgi:hypothetical protein